ncbi:site-specific integrase [Flavobacterium segetis]|uniref:hypothetical protein n=1 Tax=Flavobacterium segetis TaxID=271157 RepID=UPI00190EC166|nr:hypothetical protein [Flavobacterium segetis]
MYDGQVAGNACLEKSLHSVLKLALQKAKITKPVSLHWLRHSYAMHLLESDNDFKVHARIIRPQQQQNHRNLYARKDEKYSTNKKPIR